MKIEYLGVVFILFLASCGIKTVPKLSMAEKNFAKIKITTGKRDVSLQVSDKQTWDMRMCFPKDTSQKKPLIIALHWAGGFDSYKEFSSCLIEPGMADLDAYIIVPDGQFIHWTNRYNEDKIIRLVTMAKRFWNIDTNKIIITGYSNGGIGSWFFADKHPELFNAAIPIAGIYDLQNKIKIPMYVIHGAKDELFKVQKVASIVKFAINKESDITFVINPEFSHNMACSYVNELKKATQWIEKKLQ